MAVVGRNAGVIGCTGVYRGKTGCSGRSDPVLRTAYCVLKIPSFVAVGADRVAGVGVSQEALF